MSMKFRKAMADKERLKTLAAKESVTRKSKLRLRNRVYYLGAILWAILAALPSVYIGRPTPYMVGSTAPHDIHSRVAFRWHDSARENNALKNLEAQYANRYRELPLAAWAAETHVPVGQFLTRAAAAESLDEAIQIAKELNIPVTDSQVEDMWRIASEQVKNAPYHYLVTPMKEILDNEVYPQGILDASRFELERGRTIKVISGESTHSVMVGGEKGPSTVAQLGTFLDGRFRVRFSPWIPDSFKQALRDAVLKRLKPNLIFDEAGSKTEFEELREELLTREQTVAKNAILLSRGETITLDKLNMLSEEEAVFRRTQGWLLPATRFVGNFLLFAAISFSVVIYFIAAEGRRPGTLRRFLATSMLCLFTVLVGYALIAAGLPGTLLPVGLAVGIAAIGMNSWNAIFTSAITSLCGLILFEGRPDLMVAHLAAGLFFIHTAVRCRKRVVLVVVSFLSGLIGAFAFIAWNFSRGDLQSLLAMLLSWSQALDGSRGALLSALALLLNWLLCGFLILAILPLIERFFKVTTRIHLQDLASQEHPLLRRLIIEAPGTYHHCSIVSTLAEAAAADIGADGLRARIGGLFHDIGKLLKPEYFTENEFGVSRHENMNPNMSALLIINHVRDGAEMARTFGLPNLVVDMILQHHGDSVMKFFYHKAIEQAPPGAVIAREPFLYPGPKPQSPEAGVLMIADAVEAAVRSLDNPSPQHLRNLLARLIRDRLIDGQFEESGLSMKQLGQIEDVLFRMLVSMYHTRVKYPGQERENTGRKR